MNDTRFIARMLCVRHAAENAADYKGYLRMAPSRTEDPPALTWQQAEEIFPGCSAEWDVICVRANLAEPEVRLVLDGHSDDPCLRVIQVDDGGRWALPPEWRRWSDGEWTEPLAVTVGQIDVIRMAHGITADVTDEAVATVDEGSTLTERRPYMHNGYTPGSDSK